MILRGICTLRVPNNARCLALRGRGFKSTPSSSLMDTASDFWSSMRRRAAVVLTESLSEKEKKDMLDKMGVGDTNDTPEPVKQAEEDSDTLKKTIAEAVAQAKIEEAQQQEKKWKLEKDKVLDEAERAARERVAAEMRIQKFQQWQQEVEASQNSAATTDEADKVAAPAEISSAHPVLGVAYADLGYKRVHLASAKNLADIPVWKKQRVYRHARVKAMAQDKMKTLPLGMPGIISLYEDMDGKLSIIDGQHRVGMMSVLQDKAAKGSIDLDNILVEVYKQIPEYGENHAKDLFLEVNKAEPIKLVDMPGVATSGDRTIISRGAELLMQQYPDMFSPSQRCRVPHLNIDNLRDALFAADVIKRHGLTTHKALEKWLLDQNQKLAEKFSDEEEQNGVSATAMKKAMKHGFFLGLDSSWYYN